MVANCGHYTLSDDINNVHIDVVPEADDVSRAGIRHRLSVMITN